MKKRAVTIMLVLCMAMAVMLSGCGSDKPYGDYDLSEYVKVGEYKGLERDELDTSVRKSEVEDKIQANLEAASKPEKKTKGKVKEGDTVNIDFKGTIDGKAFEGGTAKNQKLIIGSDSYIDGFEDGLVDAKIGSTKKLNLTFPKDYQKEDLQGKDVTFEVKINYTEGKKTPEYTTEWVKENSDAKSKKEYEEITKKALEKEKKENAKMQQKTELWQQVLSESTVKKYPEKEMELYVQQIEDTYEQAAKNAGVSVEEFWKQSGIKSEKEYHDQNKKSAQIFIKQQMVLYYIADKEGLKYTEDQEEKMRQEISKAGYDEESFKEAMGQSIDESVSMTLTYDAVADFIYDHAKERKLTEDEKKAKEDAQAEEARGGDNAVSNDEPGGADA